MKGFIFICVFVLAATTVCFSAEKSFYSDAEFNQWATRYYLKPEPERIPEAFKYYCDSSLAEKKTKQVSVAAFFAGLFKKNPKAMQTIFEEIAMTSVKATRYFLLDVLGLTNTAESRTLLDRARQEWIFEGFQKKIDIILSVSSLDPMIGPVKSTVQLDMLWSEFFATGDDTVIKKIISALPLLEEGHGAEIMVGGAAQWSLTKNALEHKRVYQICDEEADKAQGTVKKLLEDILDNVDRKKGQTEVPEP